MAPKKSKQIELIPVQAEPAAEGQDIVIQERPAEIQRSQNDQIDMLIAKAVDRNVSIETMERLLAMRKELRAEKAKEAFDNDMAIFQGKCPIIKKRKAGGKTKAGVVAYKYAPLEDIVEQTKELISQCGFSYAIKTEIGDKVKAICIVKHRMGHSETSDVELPLTTRTEIMSAPQQVSATITFAKRIAFINAFGIMTGDDDNDGANIGTSKASKPTPQTAATTIAETIATIKATKDKKTLETWKGQIEGSTFYDENQKRLLLGHITNQLAQC